MVTAPIHDNLLISYEVHCEKRTIMLRTEYCVEEKPTEFTNIVFEGVHGYNFENDAFGNIILDLETVSVEYLLTAYGPQISESTAWRDRLGLGLQIWTQRRISCVSRG